jgi:DNA-binding winged helix-turn-helix (wHTH) protein
MGLKPLVLLEKGCKGYATGPKNRGMSRLTIIDSHKASRDQIEAALLRAGIEGVTVSGGLAEGPGIWIGRSDETPPGAVGVSDRFVKPVRLGAVIDRVRRVLATAGKGAQKILIGPFVLDDASNELLLDDDRAVRLTDKEKKILQLLNEANGGTVSREILLEKVWGYAPNLETHTLETHIYRLRQKIEDDPASPLILLTDDTGYKLSQYQ